MSWLSSIFTTDTVSKSVDAIIDTGDAIWYTDEEKAKAHQLSVETKLKALKLFEPFKLIQRHIALVFVYNFVFAFWVGVLIFMYGNEVQFKGYMDLVVSFSLGWIMLTIISFYFAGGFVSSFKGVKGR